MFRDDQGSWIVMFFSCVLTLFIVSNIYNLFVMSGGDSMSKYLINQDLGIRFDVFAKAAATGTWCGDFFTAWMVSVYYGNPCFLFPVPLVESCENKW